MKLKWRTLKQLGSLCYSKVQPGQQDTRIHRVRVWAGVNIQKFITSKNGEQMPEYGLEYGMKLLHEEIDMIRNRSRLGMPLHHSEPKGRGPGLIASQCGSLLP